jgi:signal transduction histidine kinase
VSVWRRFDPRLHLAAAIGWAVFSVVALAALVTANVAANEAEARARADTERLLAQYAIQIRQNLAMNLETRRSILQATAAQIVASSDRGSEALRRHLAAVQLQFPEFSWLGVADDRGRVIAAGDGMLEGEDVSMLGWFVQGRLQPLLGAVVQAPQRRDAPAGDGNAPPARVIDLAVPLMQTAGRNVGVLGAQLSWAWVDRLQSDLLRALNAQQRLDLLVTGEGGIVLVGPSAWLGRQLPADADLSGGGVFQVGQHAEPRAGSGGLGWTVIVRQDAATALAPARAARRTVFLTVLLAGLVSAAAAVAITRVLTRRLELLAAQAQAVQRGQRQALVPPPGRDEVSRIGATLGEVVSHLLQEKQALQALNAELDQRVAERTARIERLADDARRAAVTRERLRLARDLHDTLAHSLMALLTQIRLVRKLRSRLADSELEAELARAEEVAATGLAEARSAIGQMRRGNVGDEGLGSALQELLKRFGERSGVATTLQAEPRAAGLAGERAEAVYRIVEEALRNVERHAQAQAVQLRLTGVPAPAGSQPDAGAPEHLRLEIIDDGTGFDPTLPRPGHFGLHGMQEQAALIGARLELISQPGQGTRVVLDFDA